MKKTLLTALSGILLLTAGCLFAPYRETECYDLDLKPVLKNPVRIEAYEFQNLSGAGSLMQVKENGGLILNDPDRRWLLPPGELVPHAINLKQDRTGDAKVVQVTGAIEIFQVDRVKRAFVFAGWWQLRTEIDPAKHFFRIEIPMSPEHPDGATAARAASEALEQLLNAMLKSAGEK